MKKEKRKKLHMFYVYTSHIYIYANIICKNSVLVIYSVYIFCLLFCMICYVCDKTYILLLSVCWPWQATLIVENVHLHILPSMNPDGFSLRQRGNANNIDLNRDFPDQVSVNDGFSFICLYFVLNRSKINHKRLWLGSVKLWFTSML